MSGRFYRALQALIEICSGLDTNLGYGPADMIGDVLCPKFDDFKAGLGDDADGDIKDAGDDLIASLNLPSWMVLR